MITRSAIRSAKSIRATRATLRRIAIPGSARGRTAAIWSSGRTIARTLPARAAGASFGRHRDPIRQLRHSGNQQALFAVVGDNDLAILAALEHRLKGIQP